MFATIGPVLSARVFWHADQVDVQTGKVGRMESLSTNTYAISAGAQLRWLKGFSAALIAFGTLTACQLTSSQDDGDGSSFASSWVRPEDPQEQIGAREHPLVVAKYGGEYSNEKAERMLALIVGKLVAVSDDPGRVYRVTLLNSPKVNAFALPGGYLYITRGLLALANDSSEMAAVIAHEMAHVSANHAILRQEKLASAKLGEQVVSQVLGDSTSARVALAANQLKLSEFSREQELQADTVGIRMTGRAGYDPYAGARFLETLNAFKKLDRSGLDVFDDSSFLSSHPSTPKRSELAVRHARFFGAPGVGERERDRFLAGIEGLVYGDSTEEGFVRGNQFSHAGLGITFQAPRGYGIDNQTKAVVISGPGDLAVRFDATVISKRSSLREYMASGWINGLDTTSIEEATVNGLETASAQAKADGWNFHIHVVRIGSQLYRFIAAGTLEPSLLRASSEKVTGSFRKLEPRELKELKPLAISIVEFKSGMSLSSVAERMKTSGNKLKLLRILNGLGPGEIPMNGYKLKVIEG